MKNNDPISILIKQIVKVLQKRGKIRLVDQVIHMGDGTVWRYGLFRTMEQGG